MLGYPEEQLYLLDRDPVNCMEDRTVFDDENGIVWEWNDLFEEYRSAVSYIDAGIMPGIGNARKKQKYVLWMMEN